MNKEVGSVDNNLKLLKNEHEQVTSQLKLLTISLQNRVQENNDNAEAIKMLHEKILGLNNEISTLETLLKNCCKSYDSQSEFIKSFIEAQKAEDRHHLLVQGINFEPFLKHPEVFELETI